MARPGTERSQRARDTGVQLGSTLTFDVRGVRMDFRVTSLRTVQWRSFAINFFLVVEPRALVDSYARY